MVYALTSFNHQSLQSIQFHCRFSAYRFFSNSTHTPYTFAEMQDRSLSSNPRTIALCVQKEVTNHKHFIMQIDGQKFSPSCTLDMLDEPTRLKLSALSHLVTRHCFVYFVVLWKINCAFIYIQHFLSDFAGNHKPLSPDPRNFQWRQVIYWIFKPFIELGLGRGFKIYSLIHILCLTPYTPSTN